VSTQGDDELGETGKLQDGICTFALIVFAVVFGGLAAFTYASSGMSYGVIALGGMCGICVWAAAFASARIAALLTSLLTSGFP